RTQTEAPFIYSLSLHDALPISKASTTAWRSARLFRRQARNALRASRTAASTSSRLAALPSQTVSPVTGCTDSKGAPWPCSQSPSMYTLPVRFAIVYHLPVRNCLAGSATKHPPSRGQYAPDHPTPLKEPPPAL